MSSINDQKFEILFEITQQLTTLATALNDRISELESVVRGMLENSEQGVFQNAAHTLMISAILAQQTRADVNAIQSTVALATAAADQANLEQLDRVHQNLDGIADAAASIVNLP